MFIDTLLQEWFPFNPWIVWPVTALFVFLVVQLWFLGWFYAGIRRTATRRTKGIAVLPGVTPPVSVIVCAYNQAEALVQHLPAILEQDYPEFQVIVVNAASMDHTEDVLQQFESFPHFYHTFVPPGVRSISPRKMAMTIGIKAAKYDHVLFADPMGLPASNRWLMSMMRHFDDQCGVVLGYASNQETSGFIHQLIAYDTLFSAMQFMGLAIKGLPYKAHPANLAFKKELFFANKGFSSHLSLQSGDDDLLIREIATANNVRIEVSPDSLVHLQQEEVWLIWKEALLNHFTTTGKYKMGVRCLLQLDGWSKGLFYALFAYALIAVVATGLYFWLIPVLLLFLTRTSYLGVLMHQTARQFNEPRFVASFLLYDLALPFVKGFVRMTTRSGKGKAYTWEVIR